MKLKNMFISGGILVIAVLLAVGISQTTKATNVEATLRAPDYEVATALIAKGGCVLLAIQFQL